MEDRQGNDEFISNQAVVSVSKFSLWYAIESQAPQHWNLHAIVPNEGGVELPEDRHLKMKVSKTRRFTKKIIQE